MDERDSGRPTLRGVLRPAETGRLAGLRRDAPVTPALEPFVERMTTDRESVRVEQVTTLAGTSVRSLQRLFARYVGLSPKAVLARYRLQDAAALIDGGAVDGLAGLAASLGWFDQAHVSRDFAAVVGQTPSAYLRRARAVPRR